MAAKSSFQLRHFLLETLGTLLCVWGLMVNPGFRWILWADLSLWVPPFQHSLPNFLAVLPPPISFLWHLKPVDWGCPHTKDYKHSIPSTVSSSWRKSGFLRVTVRWYSPSPPPPVLTEGTGPQDWDTGNTPPVVPPIHVHHHDLSCSSFSESTETRNSHLCRINVHHIHLF